MNLFDNSDFIFNCPYTFADRFSGADDYFKPSDDVEPDPVRGLAMRRTNLIPDIVNCELPLDNRRSPGYRRIEPHMGGNRFYLWIGQHETGRYSKAHKHASAAVLVCIKGKGYTYTWPEALGITPWQDGKGDKVLRQDYEPVGIVSAAPMSGDWFHQHFGVGKEGLRITAWHGPNNQRSRKPGRPGEQLIDYGAIDLNEGRQRDPVLTRRIRASAGVRGDAARRRRREPHGRAVLSAVVRRQGRAAAADVAPSAGSVRLRSAPLLRRCVRRQAPSPPVMTVRMGSVMPARTDTGVRVLPGGARRAVRRLRRGRGAAAAAHARALRARVPGAGLAVAVGRRHDPVGRQVAVPPAASRSWRARSRPASRRSGRRTCSPAGRRSPIRSR